jgi:hypothetical protein
MKLELLSAQSAETARIEKLVVGTTIGESEE